VEISNVSGSVQVTAWDRGEVEIRGRLGEGTERLDVTSSGDRVSIRVVIPRGSRNVEDSDLEIRVPARKNLTVRTVSAEIEISGVAGIVDAEATSGSVEVSGNPGRVRAVSTSGEVSVNASTARLEARSTSGSVEASGRATESVVVETVSGDLEVNVTTPEMMAKSVSGGVSLAGVTRRLATSTVSGDIEVNGGTLQYASFETVSGSVSFEGNLEGDAALNIASHSGDVVVALPSNVSARFQLSSFSGDVRSDFGGQRQRLSPGRGLDMSFSIGSGNALVTIKTFSGSVSLERR
jgi:DUF4097 and DUF4098 domain-containing protein YvlB